MISIKNCAYSYKENRAFQNVNFSLDKGEMLCICGRNGGGKSTLLQIIAGILEPCSGEIYINSKQIVKSEVLQANTAMLFQDADIQLLGQTVIEEVLLAFPNPTQEQERRARELLVRLNLWDKRENTLNALSYGEKRKLCFAASLIEEPEILLLDEPSAGLDYPAEKELIAILQENKNTGLTQIIASHDLDFCADFVDKILLLSNGEQVYFGDLKNAIKYIENTPEIGVKIPFSKG